MDAKRPSVAQPLSPNLHRRTQGAAPHDLVRELDAWLMMNFPQIEFPKHHSSVSAIAFFAHHSLSLIVVLVWVAILTGFKAGSLPSQIPLFLATTADPFLHCTLALAQRTSHCCGVLERVVVGRTATDIDASSIIRLVLRSLSCISSITRLVFCGAGSMRVGVAILVRRGGSVGALVSVHKAFPMASGFMLTAVR